MNFLLVLNLLCRFCYSYEESYVAENMKIYSDFIKAAAISNGAIGRSVPQRVNLDPGKKYPIIDGIPPETYKDWKFIQIVPYFSCSAALGLVKTGEAGREVAKKYILWHLSSINTAEEDYCGVDGTIYDIRCFIDPKDPNHVIQVSEREYKKDVTPDDLPSYDSTDSYASLFITLLKEYTETFNDKTIAVEHKAEVERILSALFATYNDKIGLTYAKPSYKILYTMDNTEVFQGLSSASWLFKNIYNDDARAKEYADKAARVANVLNTKAWDEEAGCYYTSITSKGVNNGVDVTDKSNFYPLGSVQLFPLSVDMPPVNKTRNTIIYNRFKENFLTEPKNWAKLTSSGFPWAVLAAPLVKLGDIATFKTYMESVFQKYGHKDHFYPWEAGHIIYALECLRKGDKTYNIFDDTPVEPTGSTSTSEPTGSTSTSEPTGSTSTSEPTGSTSTSEQTGNTSTSESNVNTETKPEENQQNEGENNSTNAGPIIGGIVCVVIVVAVVVLVVLYLRRRKYNEESNDIDENILV